MKQLDPRAVWFFFIRLVLRAIPLFVVLTYYVILQIVVVRGVREQPLEITGWWIVVAALIFFVACFVWAKLSYRFYRYELTDAGFRKELGVITKKYVTIPYDRIQNVDIYRGLLARLLGLSDLRIQTAGAGGVVMGEGRLPGLSRDVAEQLRDELIRRARQAKPQGL